MNLFVKLSADALLFHTENTAEEIEDRSPEAFKAACLALAVILSGSVAVVGLLAIIGLLAVIRLLAVIGKLLAFG